MTVTLTAQSIISFSALLAAVLLVVGYYNKVYDFVKRQKKQDAEIAAIKEEQTVIVFGLLAALKGLAEQGCDGPVTSGIDRIEKHLNKAAHGQLD